MAGIVIAVAKCAFTIFPGFAPEYTADADKESVYPEMRYQALPQFGRNFGASFQHMAEGVVMTDAALFGIQRWQNQMCLGGVKIPA
jgi:hypothetical protein